MPLTTLATEQSLRADLSRYSRLGGLNAALLTDLRQWLPGDLANLANRRKHGLRLWSMLTFAWWLEARS